MNIILCGLPMSGKSTIGKLVAEKLHWNFIDTDRLIENAYLLKTEKKSTCRQIFLEEGEMLFRDLEKQQIASLKGSKGNIISLGGGSLGDPENRDVLKLIGKLVFLKTPLNMLWERLQRRGIPAYLIDKDINDPEKVFYQLAQKRIPIYEKAADFIIDTAPLNEQEVVAAILELRI